MSEEVQTQYVFLDATGIVVANSPQDLPLTQSKVVASGAVLKIAGAPIAVKYRGQPNSDIYHQKTSGDGTDISHYAVLEYIEWEKARRYAQIDAKTDELIKVGFTHDSKQFSLSLAAQSNWNGLITAFKADLITDPADFPFHVTTLDNDDYAIPDGTALLTIGGLVLGTVSAHLTSGRILKKAILDATTMAEIASVVDDR